MEIQITKLPRDFPQNELFKIFSDVDKEEIVTAQVYPSKFDTVTAYAYIKFTSNNVIKRILKNRGNTFDHTFVYESKEIVATIKEKNQRENTPESPKRKLVESGEDDNDDKSKQESKKAKFEENLKNAIGSLENCLEALKKLVGDLNSKNTL